ncbi:MAG: hypothetical protein ACMUJM_02135 [bacterium]
MSYTINSRFFIKILSLLLLISFLLISLNIHAQLPYMPIIPTVDITTATILGLYDPFVSAESFIYQPLAVTAGLYDPFVSIDAAILGLYDPFISAESFIYQPLAVTEGLLDYLMFDPIAEVAGEELLFVPPYGDPVFATTEGLLELPY